MKFTTFACLLLANVVQGCTKDEEDAQNEFLRDHLKQNIGTFAAELNMSEQQALLVANAASCTYGKTYINEFCSMDIPDIDILEICCYSCKVSPVAPAPTAAQTEATTVAPTSAAAQTTAETEATTVAPTSAAAQTAAETEATTVAPTSAAAQTAAETKASTVAPISTASQSEPAEPKECQDDKESLNSVLTTIALLSDQSPDLRDNEVVQEIINFRMARGNAGFTCEEAKLFLDFGGYTCSQNLGFGRITVKLENFCCHSCRPAPELSFRDCTDIESATTCEERAQCDAGYKTFIMAIADKVDVLPFPPSQIYCQLEQQIDLVDGTQPIDWNAVANSFVGSGADSCIATTGLFGDAAANLIGQLPATMPVNGWSEISGLMGDACTATQSYEESFNTLLQAMPDNAEDYNMLLHAVGSGKAEGAKGKRELRQSVT